MLIFPTKILLRTLVAGFYKQHAGLLLMLFVGLFINFFFTNVLNQTHLTDDQILLNNFKLALTSVSNPVAAGVLFAVWLIYTLKACKYIAAQLLLVQYQFLFYSCNALSLSRQFGIWFIVQTAISLPIIALGVFAAVLGLIFNYYAIPIVIPPILLLLISGSALYYMRLVNGLDEKEAKSYAIDFIGNWPKPFFSLFFYQIIYGLKLTYFITKIISGILIIGMYNLFGDKIVDLRTAAFAGLCVLLAHSVLIYQSHEFERSYLRIFRNFPTSEKRQYFSIVSLYFLMIVPEVICIFGLYGLEAGLEFSMMFLSGAALFRVILFPLGEQMSKYMRIVFGIFILSALVILFGWTWWLYSINVCLSIIIFHYNYYRSLDS